MEVESRLLLYVVLLACGIGIASIVVRRSASLKGHALVLVALAAAAVAGLVVDRLGPRIAWPAFGAWALVSVAPVVLVHQARRAASRRRYAFAAGAVEVASGLLLLPRPLRREARVYAALAAADSGDEARCRRAVERVERLDGPEGSPETLALGALLPAVAARRWTEVLEFADRLEGTTPLVLAAEASAAVETGDLARALTAERRLTARLPEGAPALQQVRRTVLAEGGRAAFLADAAERGYAVTEGPRGALDLALGRAHERRGDAEEAARHYRVASQRGRGRTRADAVAGLERCASGRTRTYVADAAVEPALDGLEAVCAAERPHPETLPVVRRGPATVALCAVTVVASVLAFFVAGCDVLGLVASGALSAPLVRDEGQGWRLVTAMLLHGGPAHLLLNVASVFVVALPYEERMGPLRTLIVYLGSGVLASAASVWVHGTEVGIGASGAAMGTFGALVVLLVARGDLFDRADRRRWLVACGVIVVANAGIGWIERQAIDNAAHAGGMVAGAALAWGLLPRKAAEPRAGALRRLAAAALLLCVTLSVAAAVDGYGEWSGSRTVTAADVTVSVPAWLRVEDVEGLGAVATRRPLPFAVQWGRTRDASPDPTALAAFAFEEEPDDEPPWRLAPKPVFAHGGADRTFEWVRRSPDEAETPVRAVVALRDDAFAVTVLSDAPEDREAFGPWVEAIARTLAAAGGPAGRSEAR